MNEFLAIAAQNTVAAAVLAVVVYGVTRVCRRPPIAHVLWLVVLVKLIGPPIVPVAWLAPILKKPAADKPAIESRGVTREPAAAPVGIAPFADPALSREEPAPVTASEAASEPAAVVADDSGAHWTPSAFFDMVSDYFWMYWSQSKAVLFFVWMAGFALCGAIGLRRALRFDSMLQGTLRAPDRLQSLAAELARKLALSRVPDLRLVDGCRVPLVWCFRRRPIIVLPTRLVHELDDEQTSMVLAHELAHLCRRDHWVRSVEFLVSVLYWWNPLVWWVRRQLHQIEELCCDAWVEWLYPDCKKRYAEVLFKAATFAGAAPRREPSLATGFLNQSSLQTRIEAILAGRLSRRLSRTATLILAVAALVLLPSFVLPAEPPDTPSAPFDEFGRPVELNPGEAAKRAKAVKQVTAKPDDDKTGPTRAGIIVGKVTVEGTGEPVSGAVLTATLGTMGGREYQSVTAITDANGSYSLVVPFGNVATWPWTFQWPPGYWLSERHPLYAVVSAAAPVVTRNYALRRGPVWKLRVRDAASHKPLPGIRCTAADQANAAVAIRGTPHVSFAETDRDGIALVTLPGFHGKFQVAVFDEKHRGKFELAAVSFSITPGFNMDLPVEIAPGGLARRVMLKNLHLNGVVDVQLLHAGNLVRIDKTELKSGDAKAVVNAPAIIVDGEVLIDVDLKPTASEAATVVRGFVLDRSQQPIAGARVEAAQVNPHPTGGDAGPKDGWSGFLTGMSTTTGTDGRFEIRNPGIRTAIPGAKLALVVTKEGYAGIDTSPRALPEKGQKTPLDFGPITLMPAKSVRVRVVDAWERPAVGAWVEPKSGLAVTAQNGATDERGECVLRNLPPGMVRVIAYFGDSWANAVAFPADVPRTVTLRLRPFPGLESAAKVEDRRPLALGTSAPPITVVGWSDGVARKLADYRGKLVVLDFWGTWCGPCVSMLPMRKDLEAKYKERDVEFLAVHTAETELEQIREFQLQKNYTFVTAVDVGNDVNDGATAKAYAIHSYPTVFIIGRDGRIAWSADHLPPADRLRGAIDSALATH